MSRNKSINFNTSDNSGLQEIRGIGDVLAARIIVERKENSFSDESDFTSRVSGMTDKFIVRINRTYGMTVSSLTKTAFITLRAMHRRRL